MNAEKEPFKKLFKKYYELPNSGTTFEFGKKINIPTDMRKFQYLLTLALAIFFISNDSTSQSITNVSPNNTYRNMTLNVTISGQNTNFNQASSSNIVRLEYAQGSSSVNSFNRTVSTNTSMNARFYIPGSAPTGLWDLVVINSFDGLMRLSNAVTVNTSPPTPILTNITPDTAIFGQSLTVTITGQNTNFSTGSGTLNASFRQGTPTVNVLNGTNETALSPTSVSAQFAIPAPYVGGTYNVYLQGLILNGGFYINAGSSIINGTITQQVKSAAVFEPVEDFGVYLLSWKNDTLLKTKTDVNGFYEFEYLPYGTYKIVGENADNSNPIIVIIDANNPNLIGLNLILDDDKLVTGLENHHSPIIDISVYPNPLHDNFNVMLDLNTAKNVRISLLDVTGKIITTLMDRKVNKGPNTINFETSTFNHGQLFFLRIDVAGESPRMYKMIQLE